MNNKKDEAKITHRYLARIVIETETPIVVHAGKKDLLTDAVVMKDVNGLPYIPGSSIAGVIRHAWKDAGKDIDQLFGFQKNPSSVNDNKPGEDESEPKGMGSRIIFTEARILNSERKVVDGLQPDAITNDPLLKEYLNLPVRQHVRITHRGVAGKNGKFDEEIVYAGTRFCFEMEMLGDDKDNTTFSQLIDILKDVSFRLGSGSRKGFGSIKVIESETRYCSLEINNEDYLDKSSNLEDSMEWYDKHKSQLPEVVKQSKTMVKLCYRLRPENFFLFGSGFGDDDADMTPVEELRVDWNNEIGELKKYGYLVPASSVKGALAHRIAYHYNKLTDAVILPNGTLKNGKEIEDVTGSNNDAVRLLFGTAGDENGIGKKRGNIIFSDMYINENVSDKIFNHVAIDRFTGGAIDGALFAEKATYWHCDDNNEYPLTLEILIDEKNIKRAIKKHYENSEKKISYENVCKAFNDTLADLCKGRLPLGGSVNRGHGIFNGFKVENK